MTTTQLRKPTAEDIAASVARSIREITEDINDGVLPFDVNGFGPLHDYVDANMYGGLCDEGEDGIDWFYTDESQDDCHYWGRIVQDRVDVWLITRARRLGIDSFTYRPMNGRDRYAGTGIDATYPTV